MSMIVFGLVVGYLNDKLLSMGYAKTIVRRSFGLLIIVSVLMFVIIPFLSCDEIERAIIPLLILTSFRAGVYGSIVPTYQDLSPTFYKSLWSLSWTISLIGSVFFPMLMGYVGNNTRAQWNLIFMISATIIICTTMIYVVLVEVDVQPWDPEYNKPLGRRKKDKSEAEPWFTMNADMTLYGLFKSTKNFPKVTLGSEGRSLQRRSNEFISIFKSSGFNAFLAKYNQLGTIKKKALRSKYVKLKLD